jgi:hypothetical protein
MNKSSHSSFLSSTLGKALAALALGAVALAQTDADVKPAQERKPVPLETTTTPVGAQGASTTSAGRTAQSTPPRPQEGTGQPVKPTGPAPRLEVDTGDHDFGSAIEGEKLSHIFQLKSAGQADLVINSAKPTCGCTVAKVEVKKPDGSLEVYKFGDPLPPGTELQLQAELDTKNKTPQASSKVNIYCNDPRTIVTLGLTARVDTYFQITPPALTLGEVSVADTIEKSFTVSSKKAQQFKLSLEEKPLPDGMRIELAAREPDATTGKAVQWDVKVTLGPGAKEGSLGFPISLRSDELVAGAKPDHEGKTATYGAQVMVHATMRGLISYEPQYMSFGLVRPGQVVARSLTLKSFDPNYTFPADLKVSLVGPRPEQPEFPHASSFSTTVKPAPDGKSAVVELTLNGLPESLDSSFQGHLLIETGHAQKPQVRVVFSGVCRSGVAAKPGTTPSATGTTPATTPPVARPPAPTPAPQPPADQKGGQAGGGQ